MPYIPDADRPALAFTLPSGITAGQLAFILTDLTDQYVGLVPNFDRLSSAIGVLDCVREEVYRRLVAPYEDKKMADSSDVFMERK